ncbi:MAG: hypothetical protein OXQ28_13975, partial [Acidobacteriota bacterium]|nr:hypothetical protein [Acidobacteriota bacterium]
MTKPGDDSANGGRERREPTFHRDGAHTNVRLEELLLWIGNHLVRTTSTKTVETAQVGRLAWAVELAVYATNGTIITGSRYERRKNGSVGPVNAGAAVASLTRRGRAKGLGELRWQPLIAENRTVFDPADAAAIERALTEA